jgi:hypothetical protein
MFARASRQGWLGRLLALVAAVFLLAGPLSPAMAQPMGDCCPDSACHDMGYGEGGHGQDKSTCPTACAVACVTAPAPQQTVVESPLPVAHVPASPPAPRLLGRVLAPEPRPPR